MHRRACGEVDSGTPALGDGELCPGGGRSVLHGLWGRRTGHTGLGGWGVLPRGWSECPAGAAGMDNRALRPGGMGSPAQGVVGVSCRACGEVEPGREPGGDGHSCRGCGDGQPGAPAWGGRGAQPRGCSESPARPMGGHLLQRTGRTGLGGTGSPAQGVFGVSCKANGGPSASENRAHRPGGDGEPCPGGVRSLL